MTSRWRLAGFGLAVVAVLGLSYGAGTVTEGDPSPGPAPAHEPAGESDGADHG